MEAQLEEAYDKIKAHKYQEGLIILERISERTAKWYYINGYAHSCMGNNLIAQEMLMQAVNMEPDNSEYKRLYHHLSGSVQTYENSEHGSGLGKSGNAADNESCAECCGLCCLSSFIDSCDCVDY